MPKELKSDLVELLGAARGALEDLQRVGLGDVAVVSAGEALQPEACAVGAGSMPKPGVESLDAISGDLGDCQRCPLSRERNRIVFGVGNPNADLVFVGEGPGREEDEKGEPFVGEAGRLLDRILAAMGLSRNDVYICNVIKCRPPGNRNPEAGEIAACEPFLQRQLAAIKPQVIVALGKFAAQTLLQSDMPISRLRGEWQCYREIPLMPTYHPAYLLRNPLGKREVWDDMKLVQRQLRGEQDIC